MKNILPNLMHIFEKTTAQDTETRIDLSDDPQNLRPAIDALMTKIDRVSASLRENQPLVILLGEEHDASAHIAFQIMVLQELQRSHPADNAPVFSLEYPHNALEITLEKKLSRQVPPELRGRIAAADCDGRHLLSAILAACDPPNAPVTLLALFNHCHNAKIKTRCADAALQWNEDNTAAWLDQNDPFTAALVQKHAETLAGKDISALKPEGMRLRNIAMAENALQMAKEFGSRLIVQQCGIHHLFGNQLDKEKFEHSLSIAFARAGAFVLPVSIASNQFIINDLPPQARKKFPQTLQITGMANRRYHGNTSGEAAFLKNIARQSGTDIDIFSTKFFHNFESYCRKELKYKIKSTIPVLFEQARTAPPKRLCNLVPPPALSFGNILLKFKQ